MDDDGLKASFFSNITESKKLQVGKASFYHDINETKHVVKSLRPSSLINLTITHDLFNNSLNTSLLSNTTGTDGLYHADFNTSFSNNTFETTGNSLGLSDATVQRFYGFLGGVATSLLFWVCKECLNWRVPGLKGISREVDKFWINYRAAQKRRMMAVDVHFSEKDLEKCELETMGKLYEAMGDTTFDYDTKSIDEIIEQNELKKHAYEKLKEVITDHFKGQVVITAERAIENMPKDLGELGDSKALLSADDIAEERAEFVMKNFGPESTGIESLAKSFVNEGAEAFHKRKADIFKTKRDADLEDAKTAKEAQDKVREELRKAQKSYKKKETETEAVIENMLTLGRSKNLEIQISHSEAEQKRILDEAGEADRGMKAAEGNRRKYEFDTKKEKKNVKREMKERFREK